MTVRTPSDASMTASSWQPWDPLVSVCIDSAACKEKSEGRKEGRKQLTCLKCIHTHLKHIKHTHTSHCDTGGGRQKVTARYLRHFNTVSMTDFDDATMERIFCSIMDWGLAKGEFGAHIQVRSFV